MPVTARLSKRFYDRFGDDIANELVNWFNDVDTTYRTDLYRLNDTNFERFDAKLGQRLAEQDAKWEKRLVELEASVDRRFTELRAEVKTGLAELRAELKAEIADLRTAIERTRSEMLRWVIGLFVPTILGIAGILIAVLRLR